MGNLSQLQDIGLGAAGVGVLSSAVAGYGQYQSGQEERAAYNYNAAVTLQQMQEQTQTTEAKYSVLQGRQASSYAAAGVDLASGSPLLVMAHTASQGAVEQEREVQAGTEQAALDKYYGKLAAFQGTIAGIDTFIGGLSKGIMGSASILGPSVPSSSGGP